MNPITMHINFFEPDYEQGRKTTDYIFRKAAAFGYDGIEFRGKLPAGFPGSVDDYIGEIRAGRDKYGLSHIIFGRVLRGISSSDASERAAAVSCAIEFFRAANKALGVTLCNAFGDMITCADRSVPWYENERHGSAAASTQEWEYTAQGMREVARAIEPLGMKLCLETHGRYIHDSPEMTMKLVDMIDNPCVGVNMDYGNTIYYKNPPKLGDTINLYGNKLFYVHVKNSLDNANAPRVPVALAEGRIDHREYLALLKENGYSGPITIEAPRSGDREWFAKTDIAYLREVAGDVGL